MEKLKTILWLWKQPHGTKLIWNVIKSKTVYKSLENSQPEAEAWCKEHAVDSAAAFKTLFANQNTEFVDVKQAFKPEMDESIARIEKMQFKMGGMGNIDLLYNVCEFTKAKFVAETGVAYGWSSLFILLSLSKREGSKLISTDLSYAKLGNESFVGIAVPQNLKPYWKLYQEPDSSALPKGLQEVPYLDVVHYDSDKSYLGRMNTYPVLYNKLRDGGIFISDDIGDNVAFRNYCLQINKTPVVIKFNNQYVGAFIK